MKERGKTPWENMHDGNSRFTKDFTKSSRRLEREKRLESLMSPGQRGKSLIINQELVGGWEKVFWWTWRVGLGIDVGLILMVIYSKIVGWI